jgi:hypothetical protein
MGTPNSMLYRSLYVPFLPFVGLTGFSGLMQQHTEQMFGLRRIGPRRQHLPADRLGLYGLPNRVSRSSSF